MGVAVAAAVAVIIVVIVASSAAMILHPPSNVDTSIRKACTKAPSSTRPSGHRDPARRLGGRTGSSPPSSPSCPAASRSRANRPVTIRAASPDVIHGFIVAGTNVNTMVVPGYISEVRTEFREPGEHLMPCHEFCGLGHSEMWSMVRVVPPDELKPDGNGRVSCEIPR